MNKKYYVLHLLPCRPDFSYTMTEEEREVMTRHVTYWKELMNRGQVLAFGPVVDPRGTYGLGIIMAENEEEVKMFIENDPASELNSYEYFLMHAIVSATLAQHFNA